jgi:hypothetical protein
MRLRDLLVVIAVVVPAVVLLVPLRAWWVNSDAYFWLTPFVLMAGGVLFVWLSLMLLEEYRRAFMTDPMSVMSLEVILMILRCGAPGALAMMGLLAGASFFGGGVLILVGLLVSGVPYLWNAIRLTLGF